MWCLNMYESVSEVAQSCPTLCGSVDCSPPGSSVRGILQARILEWAAISVSILYPWPVILVPGLRLLGAWDLSLFLVLPWNNSHSTKHPFGWTLEVSAFLYFCRALRRTNFPFKSLAQMSDVRHVLTSLSTLRSHSVWKWKWSHSVVSYSLRPRGL